MRFRAELELNGKTATGISVPDSIVEGLGGGRRPRVAVSFNGHTFQTSLGTMDGQITIPVSAAVRSAAGVQAGDRLDVEIALSTQPVQVAVPDELTTALAADPDARAFFDRLTPSQQRGYTDWIEQAKTSPTRQRRLDQTMTALREHRTRR